LVQLTLENLISKIIWCKIMVFHFSEKKIISTVPCIYLKLWLHC
jgi:hypothetical protein